MNVSAKGVGVGVGLGVGVWVGVAEGAAEGMGPTAGGVGPGHPLESSASTATAQTRIEPLKSETT
jgi:hypothetical protein